MTDVNARIGIIVDTDQATAQLRSLQSTISNFNKSVLASSSAAVAQQAALNKALADGAVASRQFSARVVTVSDGVDRFTDAIERNKLSLGQYTRYAASQLPGMSRIFRREFDMMERTAETSVKRMMTQYVAMGEAANGLQKALALTPLHLSQHGAQAAIAAQRQMLFNKMIDDGSTKLLNWGKNTQWAGRQLMVGFSIPLSMLGAVAAKTFMEIDKASIAFKRVYGNLSTTTAEMEANLKAIKELGQEYTKYGIKLSEVIDLSANVAATGAQGETLMAATEQTMRLATLGLMEYNEALDATIALQTAFGTSNADLASTIDFLNVVENETILTMQDMAAAIPRVAPVVKGLGGDVKDLAVFMTAMREGGISAEQGANALKSGLGRLINPTKAAREMMASFGLSIDAIVQANKGDLMGVVQDFGKALSTLGEFEQQQVLQKVFGTYQYARLGALFKNITNDAGQAARTIELTGMSMEELAQISERELGRIEEATTTKFQAALERLKISIAPLGEAFLKAVTPILEAISNLADKFNNLPDGVKSSIALITGLVAGIGPVLLMTAGLIGNGIANIVKGIQVLRKGFARLKGDASAFEYLSIAEQEARASAASLEGQTSSLTSKLVLQQEAVATLTRLYTNLANAMQGTSAAMVPGVMGSMVAPSAAAASAPRVGKASAPIGSMYLSRGGVVPGMGNRDTVPAMLTPGESVVTKQATAKYPGIVSAMNAGTLRMYAYGDENISPLTSASGEYANRSHIISMTPDTMGETIAKGLENRLVGQKVSDLIGSAVIHGIKIVEQEGGRAQLDLASRRVNIRNNPEDLRIATGMWSGTSLFTPGPRNAGFYESLPTDLSGTAILREDYLRQMEYARSAQADASVAPNIREGAKLFMAEATKLESQGLLAKEKEVDFLQNRLRLIEEQAAVDKGMAASEAKILAARKAQERIDEMRALGVIKGGKIVDPSAISPLVAANALAENPSVAARKRSPISSTLLKNVAVQKLKDTSRFSFSDALKSVFKRPRGNTEQAMALARLPIPTPQEMEQAGIASQQAYDKGRRSAANPENNDPAMVSRSKKRNSPHPQMAVDGADDQKAYDSARVKQASADAAQVKAAILGQTPTPAETTRVIPSSGKPIAVGAPLAIEDRAAVIARRAAEPYQKEAAAALAAARADEQKVKAAAAAARADDQLATSFKKAAAETQMSADQIKQSINTGATPNIEGGANRGKLGTAVGGLAQTIKNNSRTIGRSMTGLSMGLMGVSMAASMAGGGIGEMAQKIMPLAAGFMGLQMMLPMLTNPIGLATVAMTALVAGFVVFRKSLDDAAKSAAEMGANAGGAANRIEILEAATGIQSPLSRARDNMFRFTDKDREAMQEFSNFFDGEVGSKFVEELKSLTSEERYARVSSILAMGIANGLDQEKAQAFGKAIANEIGDTLLNSRLFSDFLRGVYKSGSGAAIDLARERQLQSDREIVRPARDISTLGKGVGNNNASLDIYGVAAARTGAGAAGGAAIGTAVGGLIAAATLGVGTPLVPVAAGIGAIVGTLSAGVPAFIAAKNEADQLQKSVESIAATFGSSIQVLKEVKNAEQLLLEERRSGVITEAEYAERRKELNDIEEVQTQRIMTAVSVSKDAGTVGQAITDQLVMANFSGDLAAAVSRAVDADQISQKLFDGQNFKDLNDQQKEVVGRAISATLAGITPENATQKLADIEDLWSKVASDLVAAAAKGMTQVEAKDIIEKAQIEQWASTVFKDALANQPNGQNITAGQISGNLMASKATIESFNVGMEEVTNELTKFADQNLALKISIDPQQTAAVAELISGLKDLSGIKVDSVFEAMSREGLKASEAVGKVQFAVKDIAKTKLDKKIFGKQAQIDAQGITQAMIDAKIALSDIPNVFAKNVATATTRLDSLGKKARDEFGGIKIVPEVMVELFGSEYADDSGFVAALEAAFPKTLPATVLPILLSLLNTEELAALASLSPGAAQALVANPNLASASQTAGGSSGLPFGSVASKYSPAAQSAAKKLGISALFGSDIPTGGKTPKTDKSGGGGSKEKPWWQQIIDDGMADAQIPQVAAKLRSKFNVPEQLIDLMGVGEEGLKKMQELLGLGAKKIKEIVKAFNIKTIAAIRKQLQDDTRAAKDKKSAISMLMDEGLSKENAEKIADNSEIVAALMENVGKRGSKAFKGLIADIKAYIAATEEAKDPLEALNEAWSDYANAVDAAFDVEQTRVEDAFAAKTYTVNKKNLNVEQIQTEIDANNKLIQGYQDQIDVKQELINDYQRETDLRNQTIEDLRREDELRNRVSEALSHDLEIMGRQEQSIRDTYQERIDSLEKIASINEYILNQGKQQLNIADAISRGDVAAAAAAQQEMQASSVQFATDQVRAGLQQGMQNEIDSLRLSNGMTRKQAEQSIADIKEQSYQSSLKIREQEDLIYYNNMRIRDLSNEIYKINEDSIEPLNNQNNAYQRILDTHQKDLEYALNHLWAADMTSDAWKKAKNEQAALVASISSSIDKINEYRNAWQQAATAAREAFAYTGTNVPANSALTVTSSGYTDPKNPGILVTKYTGGADRSYINPFTGEVEYYRNGGLVRGFAAGGVVGVGGRDSVPAMLTPGEFVVRKSMVNKYGDGMLNALNQGSFSMPRYSMSQTSSPQVSKVSPNMTSVSAPVYNNYSVNVNVPNTNANADEIANKVMNKIRQIDSMSVRRMNGY